MKKKMFIALFIIASLLFSQAQTTFSGLLANASEGGETLVIRHIAKVPDGREYVLGTEEIGNITDIYYYNPMQSPVASAFLKNGYSLANEKNRLIEADIVENGGKIDLEYTPSLQKVTVTYYKLNNGSEEEMGTLEDSAYVGEEYRPQPPFYDGADVLATLIGDTAHTIQYGENNVKATYELTRAKPQGSSSNSSSSDSSSSARRTTFESGYVHGYPDGTFRPEGKLNKAEMYSLLYSLTGGYVPEEGVNCDEMAAYLYESGVISEHSGQPEDLVKWEEFESNVSALNGGAIAQRYSTDEYVSRAEAVAVLDEMFGEKRDYADMENPFNDVYEDYWAYFHIISAAN